MAAPILITRSRCWLAPRGTSKVQNPAPLPINFIRCYESRCTWGHPLLGGKRSTLELTSRVLPMFILRSAVSLLAEKVLSDSCSSVEQQLRNVYGRYCRELRSQVPSMLVRALLAAEDHRFYRHGGIDLFAVARALWCFWVRHTIAGGSTIEQQLVRTLTGRYERHIGRKLREMLLACVVSRVVPKAEIPGVYLSVAYFGWQMNGVKQASRRLGFELAHVTPRQAASLVARLKYPEPSEQSWKRRQQIETRTDYILKLLEKGSLALLPAKIGVRERATILD